MFLTRGDVRVISEIMEEFSDAESFRLEESDNSNGIGQTFSLIVKTKFAGRTADVKIEISGPERW